jgi:hypothetical protein
MALWSGGGAGPGLTVRGGWLGVAMTGGGRRSRRPLLLPAGLLTRGAVVGTVRRRHRSGVAGCARRRSVPGRRLAGVSALPIGLAELRRRPLGRHVAGSGVRRDKVNRGSGGHRRLRRSSGFGFDGVGFEIGFLRTGPAECFPQCIIAVGHCVSPPNFHATAVLKYQLRHVATLGCDGQRVAACPSANSIRKARGVRYLG